MDLSAAGPSSTRATNTRLRRKDCWNIFNEAKQNLFSAPTQAERTKILNKLWDTLGQQIEMGWRQTGEMEVQLEAWKGRVEELQAQVAELEGHLKDAEYVSTHSQVIGKTN